MLGCYLVHHIPCIHDRGNCGWNSRVSRIVQPAGGRLQTLYSNSLKHPIYCTSEAVHSVRLSQGQKSPQRSSFQGQGPGSNWIFAIRNRRLAHWCVRDSGQGGCEGVWHKKYACYLPSGRTAAYKHPAAWDGCCGGKWGDLYSGRWFTVGHGIPIELNEASPPSRC
jgi:hypothetical protein